MCPLKGLTGCRSEIAINVPVHVKTGEDHPVASFSEKLLEDVMNGSSFNSAVKIMLTLMVAVGLMSFTGFGYVYRLAWDTDGTTVQGYNVYRSQDGVNFDQLTAVPITDTVFCDDTIAERTTYTYVVTSINEVGEESPPSDPIEVYTGTYGDMCGDDIAGANDLVLLANYLAGNLVDGCSEIMSYRGGDMDDSFTLNSNDVAMLQVYLVSQ